MIIGVPHRYLAERSSAFRAFIFSLSSEQWSCLGFSFLVLSTFAGYFHQRYLYVTLLLIQDISDINDGFVYRFKENGRCNGYGLYLDHVLDSIGASFAALGAYFLLGAAPFAFTIGLVLYYLIAIHSWLYKITKIAEGVSVGAYYGVLVSRDKMVWLNVDDLSLVLATLVITRCIPILYVADVALFAIFISKVFHAARELRVTGWLTTSTTARVESITQSNDGPRISKSGN